MNTAYPIAEAIKARHSIRTFDPAPLDSKELVGLSGFIENAPIIFDGKVNMKLISCSDNSEFKPSTYGVIRGASSFMLLSYADDNCSRIAAGYAMEHVVIQAQAIGLSTCWIAGTFKDSRFAAYASDDSSTPLRVVIPVGHAAPKMRFIEKAFRSIAHSDRRKPAESLFFDASTGSPLSPTHPLYPAMMLVRTAPSSVNSQPWRLVIDGDKVLFYTVDTSALGYLNLGIAMAHFAMACDIPAPDGFNISWTIEPPKQNMPSLKKTEYVATAIISRR